jgi:hypothetical protein
MRICAYKFAVYGFFAEHSRMILAVRLCFDCLVTAYYQQLADRLFGFTASCCWEGTFAGLNPLPEAYMYE